MVAAIAIDAWLLVRFFTSEPKAAVTYAT